MARPRTRDEAVRRALRALKRRPRSFSDLVDAGILNEREVSAVKKRLIGSGRVEVTGSEASGKPGRPRVIYRVTP